MNSAHKLMGFYIEALVVDVMLFFKLLHIGCIGLRYRVSSM